MKKFLVVMSAAVVAVGLMVGGCVVTDDDENVGGKDGNYFTDSRDGKRYRMVTVGNKTWMAENLNYQTSNSWCYRNEPDSCRKYGRLYFWDAAVGACPAGWRLSTSEDWHDLIEAAGGWEVAGGKLKSRTGWRNNGNGTDEFGFSALPGGRRYSDNDLFTGITDYSHWWYATETGENHTYCCDMRAGDNRMYESNSCPKLGGYYARCVLE